MATSKILRLGDSGAEAWVNCSDTSIGSVVTASVWDSLESVPSSTTYTINLNANNSTKYFVIRLNTEYTIEKFGAIASVQTRLTVEYSTEVEADYALLTGWTPLYTPESAFDSYKVVDTVIQTGVRWLRVSGDIDGQLRVLHFYGKKETTTYDLFEEATLTNPLGTTSDWLVMSTGSFGVDYTGEGSFWLKNIDVSAHTYDVQVGVMDSTGDSMISGNTAGNDWFNIRINDGAATDAYTVGAGTGSVTASGSVKITVSAAVPTASVVLGQHYFYVTITETS